MLYTSMCMYEYKHMYSCICKHTHIHTKIHRCTHVSRNVDARIACPLTSPGVCFAGKYVVEAAACNVVEPESVCASAIRCCAARSES